MSRLKALALNAWVWIWGHHLPAVPPWESYSASPIQSLLIFKVEMVILHLSLMRIRVKHRRRCLAWNVRSEEVSIVVTVVVSVISEITSVIVLSSSSSLRALSAKKILCNRSQKSRLKVVWKVEGKDVSAGEGQAAGCPDGSWLVRSLTWAELLTHSWRSPPVYFLFPVLLNGLATPSLSVLRP